MQTTVFRSHIAAEWEDLFPRKIPARRRTYQSNWEAQVGPTDDRKPLTYFAPWCYICQIEGIGTGTLIGPKTVLTCAHNVWRKPMESLLIHQGRNGPKSLRSLLPPTKELVATNVVDVKFPAGLTDAFDFAQSHLDYAILHLRDEIGNEFGYWSFDYKKWKDDPIGTSIWSQATAPTRMMVNVAGYPGDIEYSVSADCRRILAGLPEVDREKCLSEMKKTHDFPYWDFDKTVSNDGKLLRYENDTVAGNSGSPVFQSFKTHPSNRGRVLVGIHLQNGMPNALGANVNNEAVFINRSVQDFIKRNTR